MWATVAHKRHTALFSRVSIALFDMNCLTRFYGKFNAFLFGCVLDQTIITHFLPF